jgi:hypothetical protein
MLAQQIVTRLDRRNPIWRKWDEQRERLLKSATACWVPTEDLRDFLNEMPGRTLTATDVAERLKAFEEEPYSEYPKKEYRASCLELYEREKSEGTELPAIIGVLRAHILQEDERSRAEREELSRRERAEQRIAQEQQLLSGADCGWTKLVGSTHWFCRVNGRIFRCFQAQDKRWNLERVEPLSDSAASVHIGRYVARRAATAALHEVAYQLDVRS